MNYLREMNESGYSLDTIGDFHQTMLPYLAKYLGLDKLDRIVDIGAGQGHCIVPLKEHGFSNIGVVDIDDFNFVEFSTLYEFDCHKIDVASEGLPFKDNSVNWIINFHMIEHLQNPTKFLQEIYRVLKKGGVFSLVTPDWRKQFKTFYRDPTHIRAYDKISIARLMKMIGFKDLKVRSWGSAYGLGRLKAYKKYPQLGFIGKDLIVFCVK